MEWYKVRYKYIRSKTKIKSIHFYVANRDHAIIAAQNTLPTSGLRIHGATVDKLYGKNFETQKQFRYIYHKACIHMPYRFIRDGIYFGQSTALATCLKINPRKLRTYYFTGKPKLSKWQKQALKKLASPYGQLFARIQLKKLKKDKGQKWF